MRLKTNTIAIELAGHGQFITSLEVVTRFDDYTKRELAKHIAEAYGGGCGSASTITYWLTYSRSVLAIVYGGMVEPRDNYRADKPVALSPLAAGVQELYAPDVAAAQRAEQQTPDRIWNVKSDARIMREGDYDGDEVRVPNSVMASAQTFAEYLVNAGKIVGPIVSVSSTTYNGRAGVNITTRVSKHETLTYRAHFVRVAGGAL